MKGQGAHTGNRRRLSVNSFELKGDILVACNHRCRSQTPEPCAVRTTHKHHYQFRNSIPFRSDSGFYNRVSDWTSHYLLPHI